MRDRYLDMRGEREQERRHLVRSCAVVRVRRSNRGRSLQRQRPVPDTGHHDLRQRMHCRGHRLFVMRRGANGVQRVVLRGGARVLFERLRESHDDCQLRNLRQRLRIGSGLHEWNLLPVGANELWRSMHRLAKRPQ